MDIETIDKNFSQTVPGDGGTVFFDVSSPPFTVHGLMRDETGYYRLPHRIAEQTNTGVAALNLHTAGGRVRFCTDADRIVLRAAMRSVAKMPHFALTGSAGFDLYADGVYRGTFVPPMDLETGYTAALDLGKGGLREITVHFPLYSGVTKLELGFPAGSRLTPAAPYATPLPVVYYGSSITQGGCASRPGNAYQNVLSRLLKCDHLNLGFSGSALGEARMADYIAGLAMSAFVLDYDHNAPTPTHLRQTHAAFFAAVRERNPTLPVLLLSRPQPNPNDEELERREIIRHTWETAARNGDEHVFFIDGADMLRLFGGDGGTVDNCHPNDLGFACMAQALLPVLKAVLR